MVSLPSYLWLVRHGQSAGNVARDEAESARLNLIDVSTRDMDSPLSALGQEQADVLGRWFAGLPAGQGPTLVLCSPYVRAQQTAERILACLSGAPVPLRVDERLREREFGLLDRLTTHGIRDRYPDLAHQRAHVGKFYFRPPGGESWCDVILRLRSLLFEMGPLWQGERVLIIGHQVIVVCFRYLLEHLDEAAVLAVDQQADVPNCSVTAYPCTGGPDLPLRAQLVNFVVPLQQSGTPVTQAADSPAAPRA